MNNTTKITHLTSAHPRYDIRIFLKMCRSLAKHGYATSLVVADGLGDEVNSQVNIIDVGPKKGGRFSRMTKTVDKVFKQAVLLDSDIYHLHDPELIPIGLKLKKLGKLVIFDAHEDLPKQILGKPYLNGISKVILSTIFTFYEKLVCHKFDAIITATPIIRDKFLKINKNSLDINNFPFREELDLKVDWKEKCSEVSYIGGIDAIRGIQELVEAFNYTNNVKLNLAGVFGESHVESSVKQSSAWSNINFHGQVDRSEIAKILGRSKAGLVTFLPLPNHIDSQPNKMFEYMSAGLPVICSDFPLWKEIIVKNKCGLCVDPNDPKQIAEAINFINENPELSQEMGRKGREAIESTYNWYHEEVKLIELYRVLKK